MVPVKTKTAFSGDLFTPSAPDNLAFLGPDKLSGAAPGPGRALLLPVPQLALPPRPWVHGATPDGCFYISSDDDTPQRIANATGVPLEERLPDLPEG